MQTGHGAGLVGYPRTGSSMDMITMPSGHTEMRDSSALSFVMLVPSVLSAGPVHVRCGHAKEGGGHPRVRTRIHG